MESAPSTEPVDPVIAATCGVRRARVEQFDRVYAALVDKGWLRRGFRSPCGWLTAITGESAGVSATTLMFAERIQDMPVARDAFVAGSLSESGLRLLAEVWLADIADVRMPRDPLQTAVNRNDPVYEPLFPYGFGLSYGVADTLPDALPETDPTEATGRDLRRSPK